MMTSQVLNYVDFTKTQKSIYLEKTLSFLQITKSLITHYGKKCFDAEVTFNQGLTLYLELYNKDGLYNTLP